MFDHRNFALNGLFPGLTTHRSVANLGHFEIEVTITPVSGGGAAYTYVPLGSGPTKYKIKIRVSRNGKTWEYEQIVGTTIAKVVAKVIKQELAYPTFTVVNTSMVESTEPVIKVHIK